MIKFILASLFFTQVAVAQQNEASILGMEPATYTLNNSDQSEPKKFYNGWKLDDLILKVTGQQGDEERRIYLTALGTNINEAPLVYRNSQLNMETWTLTELPNPITIGGQSVGTAPLNEGRHLQIWFVGDQPYLRLDVWTEQGLSIGTAFPFQPSKL